MQAVNRVAKNTLILYIRMAITVFISLYSMRLILAALGTADFGVFNVVGGAIAMLTFLNVAMASATQRFMSYTQGEGNDLKQKNIFNVSVLLHFFIAITVVVLLEGCGYILFDGILKIDPERLGAAKLIFQFLVASTFFTIISVPYDAVINAHENMLFVAILGILESILKLSIAFFITYTTYDKLTSYGLLMATLTIVLLIIRRIYCHRKYAEVEINIKKYYDKTLFKKMTNFASWSFLSSSTSMVANYGQGIVINMFFGTIANAAQGVAVQVSGQLSAFANVMLKALNPIIDKSEGAGDRNLMLKASMLGSKISFFLLMFFYIPVLIEMPLIFDFWLKNIPEYAIIFCRLQLIRNLVEQLFLTISSAISAGGEIKKYKTYESVLNFVPLLLTYILFTLNYPPFTMYIVFIFYAVATGLLTLYFANKTVNLSISIFFKEVIIRSVTAFVVVFCLSLLPFFWLQDNLFRFVLVSIISTTMSPLCFWFIGFSKRDRDPLKRAIKSSSLSIYSKLRLSKIKT